MGSYEVDVPSDMPDVEAVSRYFRDLQSKITQALERVDGQGRFRSDPERHPGGGESSPMLFDDGPIIEKAAVNFSHSRGARLPAAATASRPALVGCGFEALAISLIVHPRNPHAPTSHANLRLFVVRDDDRVVDWWFGGGFDLTPYYGFEEDCVHWHSTAQAACAPFGADVHPELKAWCDRYFFLPHRNEPRGIGGLFFDDWRRDGFARSFEFVRRVGDHFLPGYLPILERRKDTEYTEQQRDFQLYRRGRYVEFNLLYDRGTKYGVQSGKRIETVMASMPPLVRWIYKYTAEPGTAEAELVPTYLTPKDWLA
jgi:coproporphyrinogen III oxidase